MSKKNKITIKVSIKTGNAAFEQDKDNEINRVLDEGLKKLRTYSLGDEGVLFQIILRDYNGNPVGDIVVKS